MVFLEKLILLDFVNISDPRAIIYSRVFLKSLEYLPPTTYQPTNQSPTTDQSTTDQVHQPPTNQTSTNKKYEAQKFHNKL